MYIKTCPICGKEQKYKSEITYKRAVKLNSKCKSCIKGECKSNNIKRLLSDELESFYWVGFLLADGHFSFDKRVTLMLSSKDRNHIEKFCNYVGIENINSKSVNGHSQVYVSAQDTKNVKLLIQKFDIKANKTHFPPSLETFKNFTEEQIISLIIGFIDGDGCIKKQYKRRDWTISIKNDSSWKEILEFFQKKICDKKTVKINSYGYASVDITDVPATIKLKKFAINNNLPILKRKWDKINIEYITFHEIANERLKKIIELANKGKTIAEIANKVGITYLGVYNQIKRHNIKIKINERKSHKN